MNVPRPRPAPAPSPRRQPHPRLDFKRLALQTFAAGFKDRPDTTFGNITADVLARVCPGYRRKNFVDVFMANDWQE